MSNSDDENIQKISKMLEIGGTMLAQHCENCGAPLFRYQGRVLCPVCDDVRDPRSAMQQRSATVPPSPQKPEPSSPVREKEQPVAASSADLSSQKEPPVKPAKVPVQMEGSVVELESLLLNKMIAMARNMQDEEDARRVAEYLDMIDRCMEIVAKMRESL